MESYLCEPPDTPQDKDQYKSLKHGGKKSWEIWKDDSNLYLFINLGSIMNSFGAYY
jgi:hypothetical protein